MHVLELILNKSNVFGLKNRMKLQLVINYRRGLLKAAFIVYLFFNPSNNMFCPVCLLNNRQICYSGLFGLCFLFLIIYKYFKLNPTCYYNTGLMLAYDWLLVIFVGIQLESSYDTQLT